jgi:pimeloyl-ACP methyl ester carboxylesterase
VAALSSVLDVGGIRIAYDRYGPEDAPPMLLLHAAGQDASAWSGVAPALAAAHSVYALDLRGHGRSDWPGAYSFELMRDDVLGFADALGLAGVTLVGHSLGGTVAWLVAERRPGWLARLVAEDSVPPAPGDWDRVQQQLQPQAQAQAQPQPRRPGGDGPPTRDPLLGAPIVEQLQHPDPDWWAGIGRVSVPVLLLAGGPESHVPQDRIAEAAAAVPDGRLVGIPAGHHIHRERPAEFLAAVEEFSDGRR